MQISANLYGIEIKLRNSQAVLILVIYCLIDYLVLANILSAMLCSNFAKRAQRGYRGPWLKKGKCRSPASEASRKFDTYGS